MRRRSLALTAELALTARREGDGQRIYAPRPDGQLIWVHAGLPATRDVVCPMVDRLLLQRPDLTVLVTNAPDVAPPDIKDARIIGAGVLPEQARGARQFIGHFEPDMGLWMGGALEAAAITAAADADVPLALIDADEAGFPAPGFRFRASVTRALMRAFVAVYANTANASRRLAALGADAEGIHLVGPMQVGTHPPGCDERALERLREQLKGRFAWSAIAAQVDEVPQVLAAHRRATRFDPRGLLILHPSGAAAAEAALSEMSARGTHAADWDAGEMPGELTQVLIARDRDDVGLWLRLAPVAFLGRSLTEAHRGQDPWAAAALGAALLFGPHVEGHKAAFDRLHQAGAGMAVRDADALAAALRQLSAPDRAATMAHAGWQVATAGSEATDKVIDLVQDVLDAGGLVP